MFRKLLKANLSIPILQVWVVDLYEVRIIGQPPYLMNPTRLDFKFLLGKNSPHRTESVRAIISHGGVRGKGQAAYHAGQARGSDRGPQ